MLDLNDVTIETKRQGPVDDGCAIYSATASVSVVYKGRYIESAFSGGEGGCHQLVAYDAMFKLREELYGEIMDITEEMVKAMHEGDNDELYDLVDELKEMFCE